MTGVCILLLAGALDTPGAPVSPVASVTPVVSRAATPGTKPDPSPLSGYRLGPEDVLEIAVWNRPELSRRVPVRPDGRISLPLVNDVQTAGLTPMELRDILLARLAEYVTAPEVSVIVAEVRSFRISVLGEVARPGRFELRSQIRLVDALALAGGLTQYAARSRILVLRSNGHGVETHLFDYDKLRAADARVVSFFLQPDDVLLVP